MVFEHTTQLMNLSLADMNNDPMPAPSQTDASPRGRLLASGAKLLGTAETCAQQIFNLNERATLLKGFSLADLQSLTRYMEMFHAPGGCRFIEESALDDYMVLIISGTIEVNKRDKNGLNNRVALVTPLQTVGEMSMVDGEPRFASCLALEPSQFAVMTRAALLNLIKEKPDLGARLLLKLIELLASRLRQTSSKLMIYMEQAQQ